MSMLGPRGIGTDAMVRNNSAGRLALLLGAVLVAATVSLADTVIKTDGTRLTGRIVEANDRWVILEITRTGAKVTLPIARSAVRSIERGPEVPGPASTQPTTARVQAGPGYYPLPIKGEIGVEIKAEFLTQALADAAARKPDYVVLVFDSAGGSLEEADRLIKVLAAARKLKLTAYVRKATSSAALVALACPDIYMATDGIIGAEIRDRRPPDAESAPPVVDAAALAKLRRTAQSAAQAGGHSLLIAQGIVDPGLELSLEERRGTFVVRRGTAGQVLKAKGALLTLVGREAVECGLAKGFTRELATLHEALGLKEWHKVPGTGWALMTRSGTDARRSLELAERTAARQAYMEKVAPDLERIDKRLEEVKAEGKAAEDDKKKLQRRYDDDLKDIQDEYRRDVREADKNSESNPDLTRQMRRRARDRREQALRDLKRRDQPKANEIQARIRRLLQEMRDLQAEKRKLLADAPK